MDYSPIRVLYFTNTQARGGVEEHILSLLQKIDRTQFQPYLACDPIVHEKLRHDLPEDVTTYTLRLMQPWNLGAAFELARILRRNKIGILHSHQFQASMLASPIGKICGVPVTIETPHIRELWRKGLVKGHYFVDRLVGRCVDHYICVSVANQSYLTEVKRLPAHKMVVIRSASDLKRWDPNRPVPIALRKSLGFEASDRVMLIAARLEAQKGHSVLLDAMPTVLREFPTAKLVCVSEGSLRRELEAKVEQLGIGNAVRFVGYQRDLEDWYALSEFTLLPSFFEGLPLGPIESLAAGRTVVATAVDGTPEVVLDGVTGLTVPAGDSVRLAQAMCRLLGDSELRRRLAAEGRKFVIAHFGLEKLVSDTENFYRQAWQKRGGLGAAAATAALSCTH